MCAGVFYEPHTALARVTVTAYGQDEPRLVLQGRLGARIFKTNGAYMTKESHRNEKVNTAMGTKVTRAIKSLFYIG
jgi:hypothetical protein